MMADVSSSPEHEVHPWVLAALVAAAQAVAFSLVIAVGSQAVGYHGAGAYVFAVASGALLLFRRRLPVLVLVVTVLGIFGYYALGYPPIGMTAPAFVALYTAAERGRVGVAAGTGATLLVVSLFFRVMDAESAAVLAYDLITNAALVGCAVALAMAVRGRRELREQQHQIVALERARHEESTAQQLQAERLRIARDLHDSVGHALALVSVNAQVARETDDDEQNARALDNVIEVTGRTLRDLRRTLVVLRSADDGGADGERVPMTLHGVEQLAASARETGLDVEVSLSVDDAEMAPSVATAMFRIVQEALTNALRHADAGRVDVAVRTDAETLYIRVADDGRGSSDTREGRGITGMRERATMLGGTLETGAGADGRGFAVEASLPLGGGR